MIISLKQWEIKIKPRIKLNHNIHKVISLPLHAKKIKIIRVYGNNAVGTFHIKLRKQSRRLSDIIPSIVSSTFIY